VQSAAKTAEIMAVAVAVGIAAATAETTGNARQTTSHGGSECKYILASYSKATLRRSRSI